MTDFSFAALGAGVLGGACLGLLGYLNAAKAENVVFDKKLFVFSLFPALITGIVAGFTTPDVVMAFMAGFAGKAAMEKMKNLA